MFVCHKILTINSAGGFARHAAILYDLLFTFNTSVTLSYG